MASIIKRPFKTFNGTDWDTHHFETDAGQVIVSSGVTADQFLNEKILGVTLSTDVVASTNDATLRFDKALGSMVTSSTYASLNSNGTFKILKEGFYIVNFMLTSTDMTGNNYLIAGVRLHRGSSSFEIAGNDCAKHWNEVHISMMGIYHLKVNDELWFNVARDTTNSNYRVSSTNTFAVLVPVYIM